MTSLQEFLTNNYSEPKKVTKITTPSTELLEGGELDLSAFTNLEALEIDLNFLTTPLTHVKNLGAKFQNLDFIENKTQLTADDEKLFTDLGIESKTIQNISQQRVVKEIKRLTEEFSTQELSGKKIILHFASPKLPQTKLDNKESFSEEDNGEWNLYLQLDRQDAKGNFTPSLLFWTLTQELTSIKHGNFEKNPLFWNNFDDLLKWIDHNLEQVYKNSLKLLTTPANFPVNLLEINNFFTIYFPKLQEGDKPTTSQAVITSAVIDKTWQTIRTELINLTSQEFNKVSTDEEKARLWIKLALEYNNQEWIIKAHYHEETPLLKKIGELINATPLKLQVESLEQQKAQLPTPENVEKLTKQKQMLDDYLKDALDADEYQKVINQVNQI